MLEGKIAVKNALEYFSDGYEAAVKGLPATACPLLFKAWPRDAWLKGHAFRIEFKDAREPKQLQRAEKPPFVQGVVAHANGIVRNDCPYGVSTEAGEEWLAGWDNAEGGLVPMFKFYNVASWFVGLSVLFVLVWAFIIIW